MTSLFSVETMPEISRLIYADKYALKNAAGDVLENNPIHMFARVSRILANTNTDLDNSLFRSMREFRFMPAGRVLANAGTGTNTTLHNCYVMPTIHDSMKSIFDVLKISALTQQMGGGIGMDFSNLRPGTDVANNIAGAVVRGVNAISSGPISFMDTWDAMCRTIMSAGDRRGAMMAVIRCDHPNVEWFIDAKRDSAVLRNFNVSVLVTDEFMRAVKVDLEWELVHDVPAPEFDDSRKRHDGKYIYKRLRARELWDRIMRATYDVAEPGVIFVDAINTMNPLRYAETISATNPCGEQPLPPNGACDLGAVNVAAHIHDPFTTTARLDLDKLSETAYVGIEALDRVIDVSNYPSIEMKEEAIHKRRTGLGIMGLGTAFQMLGVRYGSDESVSMADVVSKTIARGAYTKSIELAKIKGKAPVVDCEKHAESSLVQRLGLSEDVKRHGIRNGVVLTVAPTGTTAMLCHNVTSGIEPPYLLEFERKVRRKHGEVETILVRDFGYDFFKREGMKIGPTFVTTEDLSPADHIKVQAAVQMWVDASISKTVNVPESISFSEFKDVYRMAHETGCKGCTTYRPNSVTGSILSKPAEETSVHTNTRGFANAGVTYKVRWPTDEAAYYVTITDDPLEVFVNCRNGSHMDWWTAITRMISAIPRHGGDVAFIAQELQQIKSSEGGAYVRFDEADERGVFCGSRIAMIGHLLERHANGHDSPVVEVFVNQSINISDHQSLRDSSTCPACGAKAYVRMAGCWVCMDCSHTVCD